MSEQTIKYTNDGRKVLVVGQLNAKQHIVQEIFVSNGQEIPSGENFVVTSLHDAPAESWKEKNLRELEERYGRVRKDWEIRINRERRRLDEAEKKAKLRASALLGFANNSDHAQLSRLGDFLSGQITHFFIKSPLSPKIVTWDDDDLFQVDRFGGGGKTIEAVKLVSLLGGSDGNLAYRLNDYKDGSGSWKEIVPCRSYDEALEEAQALLDEVAAEYVSGTRGHFSIDTWEVIDGIVIPPEVREKLQRAKEEQRQQRLAKLREEIKQLESQGAGKQ